MVFKNNIYSGNPQGFFSYPILNEFLGQLPENTESLHDESSLLNARLIAYRIKGVPIFALYHHRKDNGEYVEHVDVYSLTSTQGLGEIEKLILEEAQRRNLN